MNSKNSSHFPLTSSKRGKNRAYKVRLALVLSLVKKNRHETFRPIRNRNNRNCEVTFYSYFENNSNVNLDHNEIHRNKRSQHFSNGNLKFNALCCFPCTFVLSQHINSQAFPTNASVFNSSTDDLISYVLPPKLNCVVF